MPDSPGRATELPESSSPASPASPTVSQNKPTIKTMTTAVITHVRRCFRTLGLGYAKFGALLIA